ncbi:MAG: hypothetical protein H0T79_00685, partial [Deltaproteobacteria bacterium]|nr:hypothetical protein [Deltaproteobacteria bacterium]
MELHGLAAIPAVRRLIELALDEDYGRGDITSRVTVGRDGSDGPTITALMNAREPIVLFGLDIACAVFSMVDPRIVVERHCTDGTRLDRTGKPGAPI